MDLRSRIAGCVNGAIVEEECLELPVLDHQGPLENRSAVQVAVCRAMGRVAELRATLAEGTGGDERISAAQDGGC